MKASSVILRKHLVAVSFLVLATPVVAIANEGTDYTNQPGMESKQLYAHDDGLREKEHASDERLTAERRLRLQTVNNVARTQQSVQRARLPH